MKKIIFGTIVNFRPDLFRMQASMVRKYQDEDTVVDYFVGSQSADELVLRYIQKVCEQFDITFIELPQAQRYWDAQKDFLDQFDIDNYDLAWFAEEDMIPTGRWNICSPHSCSYWNTRPRFQLMCWQTKEELNAETMIEIPHIRVAHDIGLPDHLKHLEKHYDQKFGMQFFNHVWMHYDKGSLILDRWFLDGKDKFVNKVIRSLGGSARRT